MITVRYSSIDGYSKVRSFKTIKGARKFAQTWVGKNPDMGSTYAVSDDGVGKIEVIGGAVWLKQLFGDDNNIPTGAELQADENAMFEAYERELAEAERAAMIAEVEEINRLSRPSRDPRCTCSDQQLVLVGCDCNACRGENQ